MFDETPRLFSVADILQKRKNKHDDYEFEDFPDTREQYATGKYDSNFDALGSEFERAHSYDLNNVKQPENTESDIDFSDYYDRLLKYEPSSYIKLEEDEIIPFSIDNEKPNEYYIDNLKDKTLDDLVISKMKEDAGAQDLPRDAMRRKFANDLLNKELPNVSVSQYLPEEEIQKQRKKTTSRNLNANHQNPQVVIEAPLSSSVQNSKNVQQPPKSARIQGKHAPVLGSTPEKAKPRGRHAVKNKSSSSAQGAVAFVGKVNPTTNRISADSLRRQHPDENAQQAILNSFQSGSPSVELTEEEIQEHPFFQNMNEHIKADEAKETKEANASVLKRGLQKLKKNVVRNTPTYAEVVKYDRDEKTMNNLKLRQALGGLKKNVDSNKAERESILSPEKTVATDKASYMGGGKSEYDKEGKEIPAKRGLHPNTSTSLEKSAQGKLEKLFPNVVSYKEAYTKLPKDQIVHEDVIRQYNKDVKPQTHIKIKVPLTVEDFLKFIDVDFERRKPNNQKLKLSADSLQQHNTVTPKAKKSKGSNTPLGEALGMMGGLG